jgi:hypothetical protein
MKEIGIVEGNRMPIEMPPLEPSANQCWLVVLPLALEIFGCLHQQGGWVFSWHGGAKDTGGLPLSVLHAFYKQRVSMAFQQMQAISILRHAVAISEGSSMLGLLSRSPPLSLFDMLLAIGRGLGT